MMPISKTNYVVNDDAGWARGGVIGDANNQPEDDVMVTGDGASDPVNSPSHYMIGAFEVIDIIREFLHNSDMSPFAGACAGNVLKYIFRYPFKGKRIEDLNKAQKYLTWLIEEEEDESNRQ